MMAIYDRRLPKEYLIGISALFPSASLLPLNIPTSHNIYGSILCHPDIYIFQLDANTCVCSPMIAEEIIDSFHMAGIKIVFGKNVPRGGYPDTSCYNAVKIGKFFFHNLTCTDTVLLDALNKYTIKQIHVSQGYTRCSTVPVGDTGLITSDLGIARAAAKEGFDVLCISKGDILLPGEKYGFLGGASGIMPDGSIVFLGDITLHPDVEKIKVFLVKHRVEYQYLKGLPLFDAGTIMFFE
jgi:hypothetical protein